LETDKTCLKQTKQLDLETKIRNLRAEQKTYRQIAQILQVSIAEISRILHQPKHNGERTPTQQGEIASQVFKLLEKGRTLSQIVIKLRLPPEVVKNLYNKWVELNQIDVNQPNLEKLDQKLESHVTGHRSLDTLLEKARNCSAFRKDLCANRSDISEGFCKLFPFENGGDVESEDAFLRCFFCSFYISRVCRMPFDNPYLAGPNTWEEQENQT